MLLKYKFYWVQNGVFKVGNFRTLKEIKTLIKRKDVLPNRIFKRINKGSIEVYKKW